MRKVLLSASVPKGATDVEDIRAAVFVGGMAGVEQEYELVRRMQPEAKCLPVASTGGAAKAIFERGGFAARLGTSEYREVFEEIV